MPVETLQTPYLLLAAPLLLDPNFTKTVVLMGRHTREGAMGWIVNRRFEKSAAAVLPAPLDESVHAQTPLHLGGPVLTNGLVAVYRQEVEGVEGVELAPGLWVSASAGVLPKLFATPETGPAPRGLLLLGYAGWGPEQLEHEMEQGAWLVLPYEEELAFSNRPESLWERALARLGVDPASVAAPSGPVS